MMPIKKMLGLALAALILASLPCAAGGLEAEACSLLAQARNEPCSKCARKIRQEAFELLDQAFAPGRILETGPGVLLIKSPLGPDQLQFSDIHAANSDPDMPPPAVTFRFHTPKQHMVGIRMEDFTADSLEAAISNASAGAAFTGKLRVAEYAYGDGETFNYFKEAHHVLVHCTLLEVRLAAP